MGGFVAPGVAEKEALLAATGSADFSELVGKGIPGEVCCSRPLNLPKGKSEYEVLKELTALSDKNASADKWNSFCGAGMYDHFVPSATGAIVSRSEFLTAYTPYQAEVSQGTLQCIYEYQSMICELTGMEVSNASMYDGATALAEGAIMAHSVQKKGSQFIIPASLNPIYKQVLKTYLHGLNLKLVEVPSSASGAVDLAELKKLLNDEVFGVAVQTPNFFGVVEDIAAVAELKKSSPFVLVVMPNLLSLAVLEAPGKVGADIVVGEGQLFSGGLSFGGPLLGFMATHTANIRQMPGRICGKTVDKSGKRGFVLTAQTREQHIRREKATSNICSNEGLLALSATISLSLIGKEGLVKMANLNIAKTQYAFSALSKKSTVSIPFSGAVFNEFAVDLKKGTAAEFIAKAKAKGILPGVDVSKLGAKEKNRLLLAFTEKKSKEEIDALLELF
ncbi:MAG: aminomethyl-transferring glycine dehydrogenase subunit GcvPA [Fibrobacteres bacterium]|nr:aminomethyl-transferring glycine dehydrogenase subunit GcvPA [Fibrobacterota bacterium]